MQLLQGHDIIHRSLRQRFYYKIIPTSVKRKYMMYVIATGVSAVDDPLTSTFIIIIICATIYHARGINQNSIPLDYYVYMTYKDDDS